MSENPARTTKVIGLAALAMLLLGISMSVTADGGLFADAAVPAGADGDSDDPTVIRSRYVTVDFDWLDTAGDSIAESLRLNLFEDVVFTAVLDRLELNRSGSLSWIGHLEGVEYGSLILVVKEGVVVGSVTLPGALYRIRTVGENLYAIDEIDSAAFPAELEPAPAESVVELVRDVNVPAADDGSIIDVLVVYTEEARTAVGGTVLMESMIDLAIVESNVSYTNSQITQRLNLVGTAPVVYDESGFDWNTTLNRLANVSDGYMDDVHPLRNSVCADEVVLLVANTDFCGIAYLPSSASSAFAVVSTVCATGYYSFGHELGHNMGADHDWYVNASTFPSSYSHGYVNGADRWRTVMAYNTECYDQGFNCTRLQYWSNPNVFYGEDRMGVFEGTSTSCTMGTINPQCDAENYRMLNESAYTVANFRDSAVCSPYRVYLPLTQRDGS